jgi:hypothetical protein
MLFYQRPTALNRDTGQKLRYTPPKDFSFAKKTSLVPLMAAEFPVACRQYPIVFTKDQQGNFAAVAVLSLTGEGNPFVDDEGRWTAKYIPAFVRRYPFVLATVPERKDDLAVAYDAESGCFSADASAAGEPLFNDKGEPGPALKQQIDFLKQFHAEGLRTQKLVKQIVDEGLLRSVNVDFTRTPRTPGTAGGSGDAGGGQPAKTGLRNALVIDEAKLQKLPADKAATFLSTGVLGVAYAHLISLQNFDLVANRSVGGESTPWWAR